MTRIYVDSIPKTAEECPFFSKNNKKCNITNDKCCTHKDIPCEHLAVLTFGFAEEIPDEQGN